MTVITECDRKLLQSVTEILQNVTENDYKMWQVLKSVAIIRKWDVTKVNSLWRYL